MAYTDIFQPIQDTVINTFGVAATLYSQSAPSTPVSINGVFSKPPMLEELPPGFGTSVVYFFVGYLDITPEPQIGDTVVISGTTYIVQLMEIDAVGGATMKLKRQG